MAVTGSASTAPPASGLRAVTDDAARMLRRCLECRESFCDAVTHGREHERMRELGWRPERYPAGWSNRLLKVRATGFDRTTARSDHAGFGGIDLMLFAPRHNSIL